MSLAKLHNRASPQAGFFVPSGSTPLKYKKGDFILVANKQSLKGLDPNKQVIIMWLCEHSDDNMQSFPSRKILAGECGMSVRTLDRHLNDLVKLNLLVKTARYNQNEQTSNVYEVVLFADGGDKSALGSDKTARGGDKNSTQNSPHLTNPIEDTTKVVSAKPYGNEELNQLYDYWLTTVGYAVTSKRKANRYACTNLYKKHGAEGVRKLILGVSKANEDKYAPRIADFVDLQAKLNQLLAWGRKQTSNTIEVI